MKNEFEIICDATKNYIKLTESSDKTDYLLIQKLNNIVLSFEDRDYDFKFTKKVSKDENIKLAKEFFFKMNKDYYDILIERLNDGTFIFENDYANVLTAYSEYDDIYKKRIIFIPLKGTIEDAFSIVHEFIHDLNIDISCESFTRYFYTEGLSFLGELLFEDFLIEKGIKDSRIPNNLTLFAIKSKAIEIDINLRLLSEYLDDMYIDFGKIMNVINDTKNEYVYDLVTVFKKIEEDEKLTLDNEQQYILGCFIGCYMYYRIKNNNKNINEFFELNDKLKEYKFSQVLDYLNLDYDTDDLSKNTYEIFTECYKKVLKRNYK